MYKLGDYLNSINTSKENLYEKDKDSFSSYQPYIINKSLSYFIDTIMLVNELNVLSDLDKDMQYRFLLESIRKRKRFSRWAKKKEFDDIETIKEYYGYSTREAEKIFTLISKEQIDIMKEELYKGGIKS